MITFHPDFKESVKNMFLSLSMFVNTNILMYEHLSNNSRAGSLPTDNNLVTFLNTKMEQITMKIDEIYTEHHEEIFAQLSLEIDPAFSDDEDED